MFCCGIKRDANLFPVMNDDKYHDIWHSLFKSLATAQVVSDVLDDSYIPITPDDIALFKGKQYLYAILESKVLTNRGKALIWEPEHDFDALKVYKSARVIIYNPPKPIRNHPSFCCILLLHGLVKEHGMVLPNHSLATDKIRSGYTRNMFTHLIIS
jgi:hypothetical protein